MPLRTDLLIKKYNLNKNTTVTIKSKREKGSDVYRNTITVEHETADLQPLSFPTVAALENHVRGIDMEQDQTELGFGATED